MKIMVSGPITPWQIDGETVTDFILGGSKITAEGEFSHGIKRHLFLGRKIQFSSVSQSRLTHELQHARPPCPSPTPRVYPNSCPLSWWCHSAISSSVVPFSSCPKSLPASESFPMSQLFAWGGQNIGVSSSASVLPMNTQNWSPLGWTGWTLLAVQGTLKSLLQHHSSST